MAGQRSQGFTLLEVLVALAVVAIGLAAVIRATAGNVANMDYLKQKTFAQWVALNRAAEVELSNWPAVGNSSGYSMLAQQEWRWEMSVSGTPDPDIRRIEIRVMDEKEQQVLASLVSFSGRSEQVKQ